LDTPSLGGRGKVSGMKDFWGNNQEQAKQKETSRWGRGDPLSVVSHFSDSS
jgi:hypothetical protein